MINIFLFLQKVKKKLSSTKQEWKYIKKLTQRSLLEVRDIEAVTQFLGKNIWKNF